LYPLFWLAEWLFVQPISLIVFLNKSVSDEVFGRNESLDRLCLPWLYFIYCESQIFSGPAWPFELPEFFKFCLVAPKKYHVSQRRFVAFVEKHWTRWPTLANVWAEFLNRSLICLYWFLFSRSKKKKRRALFREKKKNEMTIWWKKKM